MNCDNCDTKLVGLYYTFKGKIFCGKSCLVKHLQKEEVVKLEFVKGTGDKK